MVKIIYNKSLTRTDPEISTVLIVGRLTNLMKVNFETLKCKLEPRVTEETYKNALQKLRGTEMCSLYLNTIMITALPFKCSRHNTPSRCHTLTRIIQSYCTGTCEYRNIVIVCDYDDVFASGCAIVRAFPFYNKRTDSTKTQNITISVEFLVLSPRRPSTDSSGTSSEVGELSDEELAALDYVATGISLAARITDTPCNEMNVDEFLQEINSIGKLLHIKPLVIHGKQLAEKGFGGIWGVGQASTQPPALAVLSYTPSGASTTIAWVGKGIVFDTGGLCIKGRGEMIRMKQDCGGAAAILGAFYAIVRSNFSQNLHAIFCLAENAVGPLATRPDDIHTLYSGRTVEINNTDAEGRLVLADGVVYAKRVLKASIILDMATLTGAQGVATGLYHAALLTNDGDWENYCMQAGRTSGDLVFPIPYSPELHFREFDSACADMKNTAQRSNNAPCSCAGLFINAHLGFDFPGVWIHIDMAATVRSTGTDLNMHKWFKHLNICELTVYVNDLSANKCKLLTVGLIFCMIVFVGERATGYGVAFLCILFGRFCKQPLLNAICPQINLNDVRPLS